MIGVEGMQDEEAGYQHHRPTDGAPRRLQNQRDQQSADDQIGQFLFAVAIVEGVNVVDRPELDENGQADKREIDAETEDAAGIAGIAGQEQRRGHRGAEQGMHEQGENQHHRQMHGSERTPLGRAEGRHIEMKHGQGDGDAGAEKQHQLRPAECPVDEQPLDKSEFLFFVVADFGLVDGHEGIAKCCRRGPGRDGLDKIGLGTATHKTVANRTDLGPDYFVLLTS